MSLPPLQLRPISTSHYYTSGDVTIHNGAAIAPGVLIQADPDSQVIIKAGACIGIGAILHAHHGTVEVGEGANIGAEVLLIGQVMIGARACVGSASTILNSSIDRGQIVPPGSLIGDTSRPPEELHVTDTVFLPPQSEKPSNASQAADLPEETTPTLTPSSTTEEPQPSTESSGMNVYGQVYVNQLLVKMFPHSRKSEQLPQSQLENSKPQAEDPWAD